MKSEHQALLDAALTGHADKAVALLKEHFKRTAKVILEDRGLFNAGQAEDRVVQASRLAR